MARKRVKIFNELKEVLEDVRDYRLGKRSDLRVSELPAPPKRMAPAEIRRIRRSLKASQTIFALYLNVSPNAVRSWEQGTRRPQHAALKLLAIAKRNPQALLSA
jgi:putative transcriptional regulator